ncbi:MAG: hypothetical protein ACYC5G_04080 [Candidatus Doudnabacteria bacterium]
MKDEFIYTEAETKALVCDAVNLYLDWVTNLINRKQTIRPNLGSWWDEHKKQL